MANLFPHNDEQFSVGLGNFITVANDNLAAVGLDAADITALTDLKTGMDDRIAASQAAREAMKSATTDKTDWRKSSNDGLRARIKKVEAKPGVPDSLLKLLGLSVRDPKPSPVHPSVPTDLAVYGFDTGINKLRWKTNGNKSGTMYFIEARIGDTGPFMFVDGTMKSDYEHLGQTPGVKIAYRVKAKRAAGESPYSNVAVVYDLELAQAA